MSGNKCTEGERARWAAEILQRRLRGGVRPGISPGPSYVVFDQQEGAIVVEALKAKVSKAKTVKKAVKTLRKPRARRVASPAAEQRRRMIAEAAYYRAMARGFDPGHELEDWLAAEQELGAD